MPWVSRLLRGDRVWIKVSAAGEPQAGSDGRVDVLYKKGGKVYRAALRNLSPDPEPTTLPDEEAAPAGPAPDKKQLPADAVIVYTDGACTGNPGPMGIGVVISDGKERREISEYLGVGTNNIAELT